MAETTIAIDLRVLWQGFGPVRAETGSILSVEAVDRHGSHVDVVGADVTFYGIDSIAIDSLTGELQVQVPVTDGTFCIRWIIATPRGQRLERFTIVPASPDPVAFGDLQQVRREDFAPVPEIVAAWEAVTAEVAAARDSAAASATSAGANADRAVDAAAAADERADDADSHAVAAAASAATALSAEAGASDSASAAAASEGAAAASAAAASGSAGAAAGSASDASSDAAAADASRRAAADSESNAADFASDAAGSATSAGNSATSAADSATLAGSSAGTAVADAAAAMQARLDASGFATTASAASVNAEASRVAAETARTGAETARTGAETARGGAEAAQSGAQTARTGAETAQAGALTARTGAEAARDLSLAGQFLGTAIPSTGADLNTIRTPGIYRFNGAAALASTNLPVVQVGWLEVHAANGDASVKQEFHPFGSGASARVGSWTRMAANSGTAWDAWRYDAPPRLAFTTGQPGVEYYTWRDNNGNEFRLAPTGIALGSTNLDTVTLEGTYYQDNGANATTANGYPFTSSAAILRVSKRNSDSWVVQEIFAITATNDLRSNGYWIRRNINGTWQAWQYMPRQRINSPAGQPGIEVSTWDDVNNREQRLAPTVIALLGSTDLNAVTAVGTYYQNTSASATSANNYPFVGYACTLEVLPVSGSLTAVVQRVTPHSGGNNQARGSAIRRLNGGSWSPWVFQPSQRVDTTAGRAIYTWDDVNAREQLIYGDTGWRNITSLLINGWSGGANVNALLIRRVMHTVHLRIVGIEKAAATSDAFLASITGFRNSGLQGWHPVTNGSALNLMREQSGTLVLTPFANVPANSYATLSWQTDDAWPTTLPGSAFGAIPNL